MGPHGRGAPLLWLRGAPNSAGAERLSKRNNTRWQLGGALQIDVRVKPAAAEIARRRALCVVRHSCQFMASAPHLGALTGAKRKFERLQNKVGRTAERPPRSFD